MTGFTNSQESHILLKIHEYQAKSVLARFGVPVPRGEVASTAQKPRPSPSGSAAASSS